MYPRSKTSKKIVDYKVMTTPALVIDGQVKIAGRLPRKEELYQYIKEAETFK